MDDLPITAVLTPAHGKILLESARSTLATYLNDKKIQIPLHGTPPLTENAGAFATLWQRQPAGKIDIPERDIRLRGCIGHIQADTPLFQLVPAMTLRAATADPRFAPMEAIELDDIQIEVSILSPLTQIEDIAAIEVGKHGLLLEAGGKRDLLLPEVPVRRGWDREQFLQAVCRKANLPPNYWQNSRAKLFIFTTVVFEEA